MSELFADFVKGVVVNLTIFLFMMPIVVPLLLWTGSTLAEIAINMGIAVVCLSLIELLFPESRENNREWAESIVKRVTGR